MSSCFERVSNYFEDCSLKAALKDCATSECRSSMSVLSDPMLVRRPNAERFLEHVDFDNETSYMTTYNPGAMRSTFSGIIIIAPSIVVMRLS
jgi:hypothetical protein